MQFFINIFVFEKAVSQTIFIWQFIIQPYEITQRLTFAPTDLRMKEIKGISTQRGEVVCVI